MSIVTFAVVNGVLVAALLAALAYVCSLPFRLERNARSAVVRSIERHPEAREQRLAA